MLKKISLINSLLSLVITSVNLCKRPSKQDLHCLHSAISLGSMLEIDLLFKCGWEIDKSNAYMKFERNLGDK